MGYGMPMMGGYGMGYGMGMSPGGAGLYLGLSLAETLIREQQRQAFLEQQLRTQQELGRDQASIAALQRELAEQTAKVNSLQSQGGGPGSPVLDKEQELEMMRAQLATQQKAIEELKAASPQQ